MNEIILYSVGSIVLISLISLIGVFTMSINAKKLEKILIYMISFAAGGLLGDTFIHLLPEIAHKTGFTLQTSLYILLGISVSFIVEKVIRWRHCHHPTTCDHPHPVAFMNLFGDAVHNFVDGMIIGASYMVSIPVGVATTLAVLLHEIPQEIGDFGVLLHAGMKKGKALLLNFLISLTAGLGLLVALLMGSGIEGTTEFLIPFAAGSFIYIAIADLIPEMHKEVAVRKSLLQFLIFALGVGLMFGILFTPLHKYEHEDEHGHEQEEIN